MRPAWLTDQGSTLALPGRLSRLVIVPHQLGCSRLAVGGCWAHLVLDV